MSRPAHSTQLRRGEPVVVATATPLLSCKLTGQLLEDARTGTEPATGRAMFTVLLAQGHDRPPVAATRWVGDGPDAALHAAERAAALREGDVVDVHGYGLVQRWRHSTIMLVLDQVQDIELVVCGNTEGAR